MNNDVDLRESLLFRVPPHVVRGLAAMLDDRSDRTKRDVLELALHLLEEAIRQKTGQVIPAIVFHNDEEVLAWLDGSYPSGASKRQKMNYPSE